MHCCHIARVAPWHRRGSSLIHHINRYLEKKDWEGAYRIACLGVTDADWRALALAALQVRRHACLSKSELMAWPQARFGRCLTTLPMRGF